MAGARAEPELMFRMLVALARGVESGLRRLGWRPLGQRCRDCRAALPYGAATLVAGRRVCAACVDRARRRLERRAYGVVGALLAPAIWLGGVVLARSLREGGLDIAAALLFLAIELAVLRGLLRYLLWTAKDHHRMAVSSKTLLAELTSRHRPGERWE